MQFTDTYVSRLASNPRSELALFGISFAEAAFFPVQPDALLIPMVVLKQQNAFRYAFICTLGFILGGIISYLIGYALYKAVGAWAINFYGGGHAFSIIQEWYYEFSIYIVGVAGFSPIPYKAFTLFSGFMGAGFTTFVLASIVSRGARFYLIAWLLWRSGTSIKGWIETNLYPLTMAASIALILTIVLIKYLLQ